MDDLGQPIAYAVLETGTPVISSDGERVGRVEEVRGDENADIFDGLVVARGLLPEKHFFVTADKVEEIFERGVVLTVDAAAFEQLPEHP